MISEKALIEKITLDIDIHTPNDRVELNHGFKLMPTLISKTKLLKISSDVEATVRIVLEATEHETERLDEAMELAVDANDQHQKAKKPHPSKRKNQTKR